MAKGWEDLSLRTESSSVRSLKSLVIPSMGKDVLKIQALLLRSVHITILIRPWRNLLLATKSAYQKHVKTFACFFFLGLVVLANERDCNENKNS